MISPVTTSHAPPGALARLARQAVAGALGLVAAMTVLGSGPASSAVAPEVSVPPVLASANASKAQIEHDENFAANGTGRVSPLTKGKIEQLERAMSESPRRPAGTSNQPVLVPVDASGSDPIPGRTLVLLLIGLAGVAATGFSIRHHHQAGHPGASAA
jgi:hypothetical protein